MAFHSPRPHRLGPEVLDASGTKVVRLFVDPQLDGYAKTEAPCVPGGQIVPDRLSSISMSRQVAESLPPYLVLRLLAHEMAHVMQNANRIRTEPHTDRCDKVAPWLFEGTADALSVHIMRRRFPSYMPRLSIAGAKSLYGLRPYNLAFTWESTEDRDDRGQRIIPQ